MPNKLTNQVILITGASSGIGADAARLFAKEGCIVVLAARRVDRLTAIAEKIRLSGGQALVVPLDVAEQTQIDDAVQTVLDTFGHIDILFNNAGFGYLDWLERLDPAANIDAQIDVNLRGVIRVTRAVLPSMLARRSLVIPWWFRPVLAFDTLFPGLVDWFLKVALVKRAHKLTIDDRS